MLQFFRINDPYRLIYILIILVMIRVAWVMFGLPLSLPELKWMLVGERLSDGYSMYRDLYDHTGPLSALVYKMIDWTFGRSRWVHISLSTLLIVMQSAIFNSVLLRNKAYEENTYLPAFLYVLIMSGIPDFFALSPQLMAVTFVLLSLNQVFRRIDNQVTDELFVSTGLFLGLATCFYFPAVIFFLIFLLSFILFSSAVPRRLLLLAYTILTVFAVVWTYFFWIGAGTDFIHDFVYSAFLSPKSSYLNLEEILRISAVLILIAVIGFSVLFTMRSTNYQQKMQQVMISLFVAAFFVMMLTRELMPADLVFFVPTLSFFLVYYFINLKRRFWRFLIPYGILIALLANPWWIVRNGVLDHFTVKKQLNTNPEKSLMGLGVNLEMYAEYKLAGPFLDDYISKQKLDDINFYDEASEVYESLNSSEPQLIVDEYGIMDEVFHRFPQIALRYTQTGEKTYERKISN